MKNGLQIEFESDNEENIAIIQEYLNEYIGFAKNNFVDVLNIEGNPSTQSIDILRMRLDQQVNNLNMEIQLRDLKVNLLEERISDIGKEKEQLFRSLMSIVSTGKIFPSSEVSSEVENKEILKRQLRDKITKNDFKKFFSLVYDNIKDNDLNLFNDFLTIQQRYNAVKRDKLLNQITAELARHEMSQIARSLLILIEDIS